MQAKKINPTNSSVQVMKYAWIDTSKGNGFWQYVGKKPTFSLLAHLTSFYHGYLPPQMLLSNFMKRVT